MNLNDAFDVVKCFHRGDGRYVYLYKFLPKSNTYHAVVIYDPDEETIVESQVFPDFKNALTNYNIKKREKEESSR